MDLENSYISIVYKAPSDGKVVFILTDERNDEVSVVVIDRHFNLIPMVVGVCVSTDVGKRDPHVTI